MEFTQWDIHHFMGGWYAVIKPLPTYNKSAAEDFENIQAKVWKRLCKYKYDYWIELKSIRQKEWWISPFETNVLKSHLLQMLQISIGKCVGHGQIMLDCKKSWLHLHEAIGMGKRLSPYNVKSIRILM